MPAENVFRDWVWTTKMKVYLATHQVRDEGIIIDDIADTIEQAEEIVATVPRPTWAFNYTVIPWEVKIRTNGKKE